MRDACCLPVHYAQTNATDAALECVAHDPQDASVFRSTCFFDCFFLSICEIGQLKQAKYLTRNICPKLVLASDVAFLSYTLRKLPVIVPPSLIHRSAHKFH